jgi:hypothetical protein
VSTGREEKKEKRRKKKREKKKKKAKEKKKESQRCAATKPLHFKIGALEHLSGLASARAQLKNVLDSA